MQARLDYPQFYCERCRANLAEDDIAPDCGHCPVPQPSPFARAAEEVYGLLCAPAVRDFGLGPWIMDRLFVAGRESDALDMLAMVDAIHRARLNHEQQGQGDPGC